MSSCKLDIMSEYQAAMQKLADLRSNIGNRQQSSIRDSFFKEEKSLEMECSELNILLEAIDVAED
ncbi:hypothetical protein ACVQ8P_04290 [Dellaglioa sp. BT-FLS60]